MRILTFILCLLFLANTFGQRKAGNVYVQGSVMGYHYEPKGFFKKEQVEIQGGLSGVKVKATDSKNKVIQTKTTDKGGNFGFYLPLGQLYNLTFSKSGYGTSSAQIDVQDAFDEMQDQGLLLVNLEFILNDNETDKAIDNGKTFAIITYEALENNFIFKAVDIPKKDRLFKDPANSTPLNLLKGSVKRNESSNNFADIEHPVDVEATDNVKSNKTSKTENPTSKKEVAVISSSDFTNVSDWGDLKPGDLDDRALVIQNAWDQLEQDRLVAVTEADFALIKAREEMLWAAERELEAARAYIDEQDAKLSAQRYFMLSLIGLILLIAGFAFYLVRSIKTKNKLNLELEKRNKKITSSINYAERIQKSVLLTDEQIQVLLPNSFVFYQPLDVVSGDFYWFAEQNGKVIIAAVDCTGHGVPGAFMSLIANTLLNQIVNEKKIVQPKEILNHLHEGIVNSLNQQGDQDTAQDGMDMSICSLDKKSGELTFAGAVNPIYAVEDGEFKEFSGDLRGIGGVFRRKKKEVVTFSEQVIKLKKGASFYMFSDGYMDQFGGTDNAKFNLPRFRDLLISVHADPVDKQKEQFKKALKDWMGASKQIDDILVIGVKI